MRTDVFIVLCHLVRLAASQTPEFLTSQTQVVAVKGETAVIPCGVRDLGSYRVIWSNDERMLLTFGDRRIADDSRVSINRPYASEWNLQITDVTLDDAGTYSCQINTNPLMAKNVKLLVLDEAPSPVVPDEVVALSGSDVEIACKLPDVNDIGTWSYKVDDKSDRRILAENEKFRLRAGQGQDSHVHTLVIKDVRAGDEGLYLCRARSGTEAETSLKVVVPPPAPALEAKAESPNKIMVRWKRPFARQLNVAGYTLYIHEHGTGKEYVFDVDPNEDKAGQESFQVGDLGTETTYTVQLATKLQMGETISMGKRSPEVTITTPLFIPDPPGWVKVKRQSDEAAEVQWSPSDSKKPGIVRGYTVIYTPLGSNKKPMVSQEKSIQVEQQDGNKWRTRLTGLKPKTRYQIRVAGFTRKGNGLFSKPLTYLHKALPPEVSLNGRVLSDNSVLLTVTSIGSARMTNVRMFYTEAEQPSWKRLDFSSEWKFTVVGGLDPRTSYFFKVKAKLGGKMKQSVTHITTPPHDLLAPHGVEVSATASTSIEVTWDYVTTNGSSQLPLGYIVHLEETSEPNGAEKRHRQSVVFNRTSVEVKDLTPGMRYNIQVGAFNGFGEGPRTDGLLFHIAESDINQAAVNEPIPPSFKHALPERLDIQSGDPLKITCVAEGFPVPEIRWYDGGEPIGVPAQGSNQLYLASVVKSTTLTCRATSQWGEIEAATVVNVVQGAREENKPQQDGVVLGMTTTNIMPTTFTIAWNVLTGDPDAIVRFQISIADASDRVLLSQTLPGQTRSFNLRGLQPGAEYRAVLRAFGTSSAAPLAEAKASAMTLTSDGASPAVTSTRAPNVQPQPVSKYRARIDLSVMDVTPTSAVLEWDFNGLDPRYVQLFEMKIKSRSNFTLLTETLKPNLNVMDLSLQPGQDYYVQVRAFDRRGEVLAANTIQVTTPTSTAPRRPEETATGGDEGPVLKRASLTLTSHAVAGESARLDWTLSGAQQADIGQFVLKVKDSADRTLLRQEMRRESRSLTLSNLTPNTRYFVELLALDDKGATIAMTTSSLTTTSRTAAEMDVDTTKLRVYTESVDTSSVKIAWDTPARILPDVSEVTVTLTDIANVTLLTQQMSALTRSLTVRNLQAGERYRADVQVKGPRRETLRSGTLEFDMEPVPGMPGRPEIVTLQVVNSSAVQLFWRNTPSPSPAAGSDDVTGYVINFTGVDSNNKPMEGTYQFPVFGSAQSVVIPNLRGGQRYMFQVAARNQYSFGPLSVPKTADLPRV